jgi:ketosteroid isomerase-like protein
MMHSAKFHSSAIKSCAIFAVLLMIVATPAIAQKKNKKTKNEDLSQQANSPGNALPRSPGEAIDRAVGEALGYWQIGDVESLRQYYADNVVFVVSGGWEPPIVGWANYAAAYQAQRAHVSGGRLDRSNTYSKINGDSAWVTYQWEYMALVDGKQSDIHGHTTLVLNKQGERWVIVLDHSSAIYGDTITASGPNPGPLAKP